MSSNLRSFGPTLCFVTVTGAAMWATACGDQVLPTRPTDVVTRAVPTQPPPQPQPGIPFEETTTWSVTTTFRAMTGPESCLWQVEPGAKRYIGLVMTRAGQNLRLLYDEANWPTDHIDYVGTADGDQFTAASEAADLGILPWTACGRASFVGRVTGRLGPDMKTLTASEQWIYQFETGAVVTLFIDWAGRQ